jgi:hypothetical protein
LALRAAGCKLKPVDRGLPTTVHFASTQRRRP